MAYGYDASFGDYLSSLMSPVQRSQIDPNDPEAMDRIRRMRLISGSAGAVDPATRLTPGAPDLGKLSTGTPGKGILPPLLSNMAAGSMQGKSASEVMAANEQANKAMLTKAASDWSGAQAPSIEGTRPTLRLPEDATVNRLPTSTTPSGAPLTAAASGAPTIQPLKPFEVPPPSELEKRRAALADSIAEQYAHPEAAHGARRVLGDIAGVIAGLHTRDASKGIGVAEAIKDQPRQKRIADLEAQQAALGIPAEAEKERTKEAAQTYRATTGADLALQRVINASRGVDARIAHDEAMEAALGTGKDVRVKNPDGTEQDLVFYQKTGTYRNLQNQEVKVPEGAKITARPSASTGQIRSVPKQVTVQDATALASAGVVQYPGIDGKPIDLSKVPPNMVLQAMEKGDQVFYVPMSPGERTVTVGNEVYAVTPFQVKEIGQPPTPGGPVPLGQARVPTASTPTMIEVGPDGTSTVIGPTTTPATPGAVRGPGAAPAITAPTAPAPTAQPTIQPPPARVSPTVTPPGQAAAPAPAPAAKPEQAAVKPIRVTQQQDTQFRNSARTGREFITHLFGDKANPNLKSLSNYSKIADDPAARARVGNALRMLLADTTKLAVGQEGTINGWSAGASAGTSELLPIGVGVRGGMSGTNLQHYLSLTPEQAAKINQNIGTVMDSLKQHPEEQELVDATLKAYEAAVGMRSLTRASSAQTAVETIQKTLPVVGVNTFSSKEFRDRMVRWAQDGLNNIWGIPPNYFGADAIQTLKDYVKNPSMNAPAAQKEFRFQEIK